jgi:hypothetical protein
MSDERFAEALREGLREIAVPTASRGFDARVLAAVSEARPGWREIIMGFRPALGGAALAVPLMFWLIHTSQTSRTAPSYSRARESAAITVPETALDSPALTPFSLRRAATQVLPAQARQKPVPDLSGVRDSAAFNS